jgi:hypothetical protein
MYNNPSPVAFNTLASGNQVKAYNQPVKTKETIGGVL